MSAQTKQYSQDFQQFLQLVEKSLNQAAKDARELAERTGTPLVVRESQANQCGERTHGASSPSADAGSAQ